MSTEESSMSALSVEMRDAMLVLGKPTYGEKQARWIPRAARAAGITKRTALALFHFERPDPRASVVDAVRRAVRAARREQEIKEARNEYALLVDRIARCEAALRLSSEDSDGVGDHEGGDVDDGSNSALV